MTIIVNKAISKYIKVPKALNDDGNAEGTMGLFRKKLKKAS